MLFFFSFNFLDMKLNIKNQLMRVNLVVSMSIVCLSRKQCHIFKDILEHTQEKSPTNVVTAHMPVIIW